MEYAVTANSFTDILGLAVNTLFIVAASQACTEEKRWAAGHGLLKT